MWVDVVVLSLCSFLGNVGVALTGFGMAIVYIFFWQIAFLSGYMGNFKYAVFIQSIALASVQPILLYQANVRKHASRKMLMYFVPITIVSTPLGQLTADYVPTNIIQSVGGVLVSLVAIREVYLKRFYFFSCCLSKKKDTKDETSREQESVSVDDGPVGDTSKPSAEVPVGDNDDEAVSENEKVRVSPGGLKGVNWLGSVVQLGENQDTEEILEESAEEVAEELPTTSVDEEAVVPAGEETEPDDDGKNNEPLGANAIFWTLAAGFSSGYLGGLCGIRGPPLIFYFLHPPHPVKFTNKTQRGTGVVITAANVFMRIVYYAADTILTKKTYFQVDHWYLYLSVILSSILGVVIGSLLFKRLKEHNAAIKAVLTIMLVLCGISLLITSFA